MSPLSRRQIDELGERLASVDEPEPADVEAWTRLQEEYLPALDEVSRVLQGRFGIVGTGQFDGVQLTASSRPKTIATLIEKIRRGLALSRIQDVVGYRVVGDLTLSQQSAFCGALTAEFPAVRVTDRRSAPSHGYRAVHIIPVVNRFPVEIQVRTLFQDQSLVVAGSMYAYEEIWDRWFPLTRRLADIEGVLETGPDGVLEVERMVLEQQEAEIRPEMAERQARLAAAISEFHRLHDAVN